MITGEVQKLLDEFKANVIKEAKKGVPRDSKKLANSIKGYVKESKNSIQVTFTMNDYGFYQDRGVRGVSSGESLSGYQFGTGSGKTGGLTKGINEWVKRKSIQFRDRETGRFMSHEQTARTIIRSIWRKGIKPSMFFTKPFEKYFKRLPNALQQKYGLDMEKLFETITKENFKKLA